jgi:hypothetical protein
MSDGNDTITTLDLLKLGRSSCQAHYCTNVIWKTLNTTTSLPREYALLSWKHRSKHTMLVVRSSPTQTSSSRMRGSRWKKIPRRGHLFIEAFKRLIVNWIPAFARKTLWCNACFSCNSNVRTVVDQVRGQETLRVITRAIYYKKT